LYRYELAQIIAQWFDNEGKELKEMCVKAKLLGRPDATFNIVRELADMANRA
jgi:1,2-diacylglycerol 3-beta-galactosyltransferase